MKTSHKLTLCVIGFAIGWFGMDLFRYLGRESEAEKQKAIFTAIKAYQKGELILNAPGETISDGYFSLLSNSASGLGFGNSAEALMIYSNRDGRHYPFDYRPTNLVIIVWHEPEVRRVSSNEWHLTFKAK